MKNYKISNHNENIINMENRNDIIRFLEAQDSPRNDYAIALSEIQNGEKTSHWIWYIFPQLRGLGHSYMSDYYGITGRDEAEAYLQHPILGFRLREITEALLKHSDKTAVEILGKIDALKVRSCMTLFDSISPNDIFEKVLDQFFDSERDKFSIV